MKKLLTFAMSLMLAVTMFAQNDVTQFLGIPVDGTKSEMIRKLKAKGFTTSSILDGALEGEFNGSDVIVSVVTNNNKVYRVFVEDSNVVSEEQIKIRFNKLCEQFGENKKYISINDFIIPEEEDLDYEMLVNKKSYEAVFYQLPIVTDTIAEQNYFKEKYLSKYTEAELENPTEQIKLDLEKVLKEYAKERSLMKPVWFKIYKNMIGRYKILMYYDNKYNEANGDDL